MKTMTNESRLFGTHVKRDPEMRPIGPLQSWDLNPRENEDAGGEALDASLKHEGQLDDVHVMEVLGGEVILRGHRRVRSMKRLGWEVCRQVVHKFSDMRDAYRFAIIDHGQTVPLNANEKLTMVTTGHDLGLNGEDLAATLGLSEETMTKYRQMALLLPMVARVAMSSDRLSMNTAELLLRVEDEKSRREAAQMILKDMETGEPMAHGQAKRYIEAHYVLPETWRKAWAVMEPKLKKRMKVVEGYHYVTWEERRTYIMGESGQPEPGWEHAGAFVRGDKYGRTHGEMAEVYDVPRFVVPAPDHKEGHVVLVQVSMLRDAMTIPTEGADDTIIEDRIIDESDPETGDDDMGNDSVRHDSGGPVASHDAERLRVWLAMALGAIYEALRLNPTDVMTKEPWLPFQGFLAHLTTDVDAGALEAWTGITTGTAALEWIAGDTKNRAHLRTTLMLLLCAVSDASDDPKACIREVAGALGVVMEEIDRKAGL